MQLWLCYNCSYPQYKNGLFLICRALCVDYWKDLYRKGPRTALLRPGLGGSDHIWRKPAFAGMQTRTPFWVRLQGCYFWSAGSLSPPWFSRPGFLHSGPRSNPQWGQVWAPPPGQSVVVRILKILVLFKKRYKK